MLSLNKILKDSVSNSAITKINLLIYVHRYPKRDFKTDSREFIPVTLDWKNKKQYFEDEILYIVQNMGTPLSTSCKDLNHQFIIHCFMGCAKICLDCSDSE